VSGVRGGDRLFLFTDGISEPGLPDREEFGAEGIVASARQCSAKSTREVTSHVLAAAKQFCSSMLGDDATLIVISALPPLENITGTRGSEPANVFLHPQPVAIEGSPPFAWIPAYLLIPHHFHPVALAHPPRVRIVTSAFPLEAGNESRHYVF